MKTSVTIQNGGTFRDLALGKESIRILFYLTYDGNLRSSGNGACCLKRAARMHIDAGGIFKPLRCTFFKKTDIK
jgi:hypothetical protein